MPLLGALSQQAMTRLVPCIDDPLEACKVLTDRANQAGGHDNVTVVVAKFEGEGLAEAGAEDTDALKYQKYELPEPPSLPAAAGIAPQRPSDPPGPDRALPDDRRAREALGEDRLR